MGARTFFRPSDDTRLNIEYHGTHEYRRGGDNLDLPAHEAMIAEQVDHNIHGGEVSFDLWSSNRNDHLNVLPPLKTPRGKAIMAVKKTRMLMVLPMTLL